MRNITLCIVAGLGLLALGACSRGGDVPLLMNAASSSNGPDEFSILPTQPLQAPPSFSALPEPTPGGTNLTDPDPRAEVVSALGGRVSAERTSGVPAADRGLLGYTGRNGVSENIRTTLAEEDVEIRRSNRPRLLERLFNTNVYRQAYDDQLLDPEDELQRWRRQGVRTPAAPPAER
ncbi:MAG: DUF3035 domain-containing protein [Paracoccaceae bacterium]